MPLSVTQAGHSRDAIAKAVYARTFGWIVQRVNESLSGDGGAGAAATASGAAVAAAGTFIGILDIYGFETFGVNSFEQVGKAPPLLLKASSSPPGPRLYTFLA